MSLSTKSEFQFHVLLGIFIFLGLLLRILGLFYFPEALEGDEVEIVYWGRIWIQSGQWVLIHGGDLPAWETPAAYIFGGLDLLGINPRWGAVAISFLELGICYAWTLRRSDRQTALLSTAFLSLMPWHFFFSYVMGPCVAGFWTGLYLLDIKNPLGRFLANCGGLLYYASYRVIMVWGGLYSLGRRNWKRLMIDVCSGFFVLVLLAFLGRTQFEGFFAKGSYLVKERAPIEWLYHYVNSVFLWWLPPLQVFWSDLSRSHHGDLGFVFAHALGVLTPLSLGTSIFFGWGLYLCLKDYKNRDLLCLFVLSIVLVGFGPSYIHFPFILPVVAFISAVAATQFVKTRLRCFVIMGSLVVSGISVIVVISNLGTTDKWGTLTSKTELIPLSIREQIGSAPFVWTVGADFKRASLAADRAGLSVFGFSTSNPVWLNNLTRTAFERKTPWVFIQNNPEPLHPRPEVVKMMEAFQEDFEKRIVFFESNVTVQSKKKIEVDGVQLGILYEISF